MHTCPATCLHHRARAGRDSVCQCLQWSDYAPVLRHVRSFSVCSLSDAAVYICLPGGGCGDGTVPAHGWAPQRHKPPLCAGMQTTETSAKAPFTIPQILA